MHNEKIKVRLLGQSGFKFSFADATVYLDPYLYDSVTELDDSDLRGLMPSPLRQRVLLMQCIQKSHGI